MNIMKVEAAGVVDEGNYCIGFVTSEDLISHVPEKEIHGPDASLRDVMRQPNMSVYRDDPIEQALVMMKSHKINWLPVIDYDTKQFCGLICRKDIEDLALNIIPFVKRKFSYGEAA
jgi:predicted transcriptional regulator